jgi:outer membrane receptor protein involved in Fe transport
LTSHYTVPPPVRLGETDFQGPFTPDLIINTGIHAFTGFDWQGTHLRVTGGLSAMPTLIETGLQTGYGPRIGILYRIDSSHVLFGNYAQSFKLFHENQKKLSYSYNFIEINHRYDFPNITENFKSAELGYRLNKSGVSVFWQESYNLLRDGYFVRLGDGIGWGGYEYAPGLAQRLWGVQGRLVAENTQTIQKKRNEKEQLVTWRGEFFIQYARGREWFGYDLPSTAEVRNFPQWITQFRSSGRTGRLQVTLSSNRQTSVLSKAVPFYSMWKRDLLQERYPTFRTWDTQLRFFVNKNFVLYLHVFNIFDRKAYGIDATGTPDDLARPLQQGRLWRLGVNYNMN